MTYEAAKFVHLLGIMMLIGNVTATAVWKFFGHRSNDPKIVGFSQRLITLTDWSLTCWGVILTIAGGYSAAAIGHLNFFADRWLVLGQWLFLVSGVMWLGLLVPLQITMARQAREFSSGDAIPLAYRRGSRTWLVLGIFTTVPLIAAVWSWFPSLPNSRQGHVAILGPGTSRSSSTILVRIRAVFPAL